MQTPSPRRRCCETACVRTLLGAAVVVVSGAAGLFFANEFFGRTVLQDVPNDAEALMWADMSAAALALVAACLLLCDCCTHVSYGRRERAAAFVLLVAAILLTTISASVRDLNMKNNRQDESYVCGRRDSVLACPSQRVKLSNPYAKWTKTHPDADECWFNTSSTNPDAFVWGKAFSYNTTAVFRTSDFSDPRTYELYPDYAPCFYYGCADACLPGQRDANDRLLRNEVRASVLWFLALLAVPCIATEYTVETFTQMQMV